MYINVCHCGGCICICVLYIWVQQRNMDRWMRKCVSKNVNWKKKNQGQKRIISESNQIKQNNEMNNKKKKTLYVKM